MMDLTVEVGAIALLALGCGLFLEGVRIWWRGDEDDEARVANVTGIATAARTGKVEPPPVRHRAA